MKLTRHNGRAGKNGVYNPKHNDRNFKIENAEHIDPELAKQQKGIIDSIKGIVNRAVITKSTL